MRWNETDRKGSNIINFRIMFDFALREWEKYEKRPSCLCSDRKSNCLHLGLPAI
jgi:hypothetical protein